MRPVASYIAAGIAALTLSLPAIAAEGWQSDKPASWLELRAAIAGVEPDDVKASNTFTAAARQAPASDVAVVELPVEPEEITVPAAFVVAFGEVLEAAQKAATTEPRVYAALQQKGFAADDVLAVTKADNGSITVFVGAAS
jgi:hypothetical protein